MKKLPKILVLILMIVLISVSCSMPRFINTGKNSTKGSKNENHDSFSDGMNKTTSPNKMSISWQYKGNNSSDIAFGPNNTLWKIGRYTVNAQGDKNVYKYENNRWVQKPGKGIRIDVDQYGTPWIVDASGKIYKVYDSGVKFISSPLASDIGIGPKGSVWIIGKDNINHGGKAIYKRKATRGGTVWNKIDGAAVRISVGPAEIPYVVNASGKVFKRNYNDTWEYLNGQRAADIGVGDNGDMWIIGRNQKDSGGNAIFKYANEIWFEANGAATQIAVNNQGSILLSNKSGNVYYFSKPDAYPMPVPDLELDVYNLPNYDLYVHDFYVAKDGYGYCLINYYFSNLSDYNYGNAGPESNFPIFKFDISNGKAKRIGLETHVVRNGIKELPDLGRRITGNITDTYLVAGPPDGPGVLYLYVGNGPNEFFPVQNNVWDALYYKGELYIIIGEEEKNRVKRLKSSVFNNDPRPKPCFNEWEWEDTAKYWIGEDTYIRLYGDENESVTRLYAVTNEYDVYSYKPPYIVNSWDIGINLDDVYCYTTDITFYDGKVCQYISRFGKYFNNYLGRYEGNSITKFDINPYKDESMFE